MNDIVWTKSYEDYKAELGQEMLKTTESFVRIGYLLKVARDTNVLNGSEYEGDYLRFAEKEFGLEKTQVSRFIRIEDKYGKPGSQGELRDEFKGFGVKKLGIMLTLPDEIAEELSPDMTAKEIETIQEEINEEQKQSPLEQYAETLEAESFPEDNKAAGIAKDDVLSAAIFQIYDDVPELFVELFGAEPSEYRQIMAPIPDTTYIAKVKGVGRLMLICKKNELVVINARSNKKKKFTWEDWENRWHALLCENAEEDAKNAWAVIFGKPFLEEKDTKEAKNAQKEAKNAQKEEKNVQKDEKKTEKVKKESRIKVTKEKRDAKKKPEKAAEAAEHEAVGEGAGEESSNEVGTPLAEAGDEVHDIQPEGSAGESQLSGEKDLGGTEGEPSSLGTGEALSGEDSGAAGGEGSAAGTPERNKYSGRLEQLTHDISILIKEINNKGQAGVAGANWRMDALKTAGMMKECIQTIIKDLEEEEEPKWREIK